MNPSIQSFIRLMQNGLRFRLFLLDRLPAALFAGLRIREFDENKCTVSVPYKWMTRNPFRSTYFASLSMAAEMSTGTLAMAQLYKREPALSMLVIKNEAEYFKKATGRTYFTCEEGLMIQQAVDEAIRTGEAKTFRARTTGKNKNGDLIAVFYFTWSFKVKSNNK
jgi:hypothetical protein